MISGALDVLVVGAEDDFDVGELTAAGLHADRVDTIVGAVERLRGLPTGLVIIGGEVCAGREKEAFTTLRAAGAGSVLAVYSPRLAWRAAGAVSADVDDVVVLPAAPGAFAKRVLRCLRSSPARAALARTAKSGKSREDRALESLVGDISVINRSVGDLDRLFEQVVQAFARRAAAGRCSLMLLDEATEQLRVRKSVGLPEGPAWPPMQLGAGLAGHVAKTGLPMLVVDVERLREAAPRSLDLPAPPAVTAYRTPSCLLLPLRASRGVFGVVCLADKESGGAFDDADLRALRFLADQAAQAIENGLLFRQMQDLAAIDELTGLANRRQFQRSLEREIQRARRYDRRLTLAIFDVDHFKKYNDACGHQAGDRALATIGEILRASLREVDLVARYGGEEFAVILPETAAKPGAGVSPFPFLERLRRRVETAVFAGEENLPAGRLTLSGGIAVFPDDADSLESLIREADRALYVSKARGRNTISYRGGVVSE